MHILIRLRLTISFIIATVLLVAVAGAQQTITGTFSGAFQIVQGGSDSPAVPAQCPGNAPISCSSIGASGWCCPSGDSCGWNGGSVGCCPYGQTCNSYGAGASWAPTSTYWEQPTTTWNQWNTWNNAPQTVTVYGQQPQQVYTTQPYVAVDTQQANNVGYCSTAYEKGPNLPTEAQGQCGTILVLEAGAPRLFDRSTTIPLLVGSVVIQVVAWTLLLRRA